MSLIKPPRPVLNWRNDIATGLVFDLPLWERSGGPYESITKQRATLSATASYAPQKFGIGYQGASTLDSAISCTTEAIQNNLTQMTYETLIYMRTLSAVNNTRIFIKASDAAPYFMIVGRQNTTNACEVSIGYGIASDNWDTANNTFNTATWYHLVCTYFMNGAGTVPHIYLNGNDMMLTNVSVGSGATPSDNTSLWIGNRTTNDRGLDGFIVYARIWNRILGAKEVLSLYKNPFQFYMRPFIPQFNANMLYY